LTSIFWEMYISTEEISTNFVQGGIMKRVLLVFASCAIFCALSAVPTQAADPVGGKLILPDGTQPKQGWVCKRAFSFHRVAGTTYSKLKHTDGSVVTLYDDGFERMAQGASDNYLLSCYYILSTGVFNNMYTY
jgi:hypothetical protein